MVHSQKHIPSAGFGVKSSRRLFACTTQATRYANPSSVYWHQLNRQRFTSPAAWLTYDLLGFRKGGFLSRYTAIFIVFFGFCYSTWRCWSRFRNVMATIRLYTISSWPSSVESNLRTWFRDGGSGRHPSLLKYIGDQLVIYGCLLFMFGGYLRGSIQPWLGILDRWKIRYFPSGLLRQ